jgi:glutathione S-transferase
MGKVPALVDGDAVVAESGAICAYVADRCPEAGLAPPIGDPARGAYLRWLFFSPGCFEPAVMQKMMGWEVDGVAAAWGNLGRVLSVLDQALAPGGWLLGDRFSAADVLVGTDLHYCVTVMRALPPNPVFDAYVARCLDRPAFQRALEIDAAGV